MADTAVLLEIITYIFQRTPPTADCDEPLTEKVAEVPVYFQQMRDRAWFVRLYGEIIPSISEGIIDRTGAQTMLYLTCSIISSVDLSHCGLSRAKDCVSVEYGTNQVVCVSHHLFRRRMTVGTTNLLYLMKTPLQSVTSFYKQKEFRPRKAKYSL